MAVVNVHEYRSLCAMPFEELATMTSQLSALDKKDNFNYLMALQDICAKLQSKTFEIKNKRRNRPRNRPNRRKRPKRRKRPEFEEEAEESGWFSWYWWDIFGLFSDDDSNERQDTERAPSSGSTSWFWFLDPLGLFSSGQAEDKADLIDYDHYYYDDHYDGDNYLDYYDYHDLLEKMDGSASDPYEQVLINQRPSGPSQSEKQRLAFVHYVYPETTQDKHFKEFEG